MIEAWLYGWFVDRGFDLDLNENYFDANAIDSFGLIELIEAVEERFRRPDQKDDESFFGPHDFQDRRFSTIAGLAQIIDERLQQSRHQESAGQPAA